MMVFITWIWKLRFSNIPRENRMCNFSTVEVGNEFHHCIVCFCNSETLLYRILRLKKNRISTSLMKIFNISYIISAAV